MFVELPQNLILMIAGAFLIGWILSAINARVGDKTRARKRDPRDDRIRSLEAELRVSNTDLVESRTKSEKLTEELGLEVHPYTFRRDELPEGFESFDALLKFFIGQVKVDGLFTDFADLVRHTIDNPD